LNIDSIRNYFLKYYIFDLYDENKETVERILINADILTETGNNVVCNVGGMLIFVRSPFDKLRKTV
jgi:ATP-dependent DNA helicase RecG